MEWMKVKGEEGEMVNENWKLKHKDSVHYHQNKAKKNTTLALFLPHEHALAHVFIFLHPKKERVYSMSSHTKKKEKSSHTIPKTNRVMRSQVNDPELVPVTQPKPVPKLVPKPLASVYSFFLSFFSHSSKRPNQLHLCPPNPLHPSPKLLHPPPEL